jgi:hypothetical protein
MDKEILLQIGCIFISDDIIRQEKKNKEPEYFPTAAWLLQRSEITHTFKAEPFPGLLDLTVYHEETVKEALPNEIFEAVLRGIDNELGAAVSRGAKHIWDKNARVIAKENLTVRRKTVHPHRPNNQVAEKYVFALSIPSSTMMLARVRPPTRTLELVFDAHVGSIKPLESFKKQYQSNERQGVLPLIRFARGHRVMWADDLNNLRKAFETIRIPQT